MKPAAQRLRPTVPVREACLLLFLRGCTRQALNSPSSGCRIFIQGWHPDCSLNRGDPMKKLKLALPALILAASIALTSADAFGKPEYTKKEKTACVTCHVTAKSKELNETGKHYADKKTLQGAPKKK
jgi:hypothetical protein